MFSRILCYDLLVSAHSQFHHISSGHPVGSTSVLSSVSWPEICFTAGSCAMGKVTSFFPVLHTIVLLVHQLKDK
jgi:hypothetical protein